MNNGKDGKMIFEVAKWEFHRWFVNEQEGKLRIKPKNKPIEIPAFYNLFHDIMKKDRNFYRFFENNLNLFYVMYEWRDRINYDIQRREAAVEIKGSKPEQDYKVVLRERPKSRIKKKIFYFYLKMLRLLLWGKKRVSLYSLLVCPRCKNSLDKDCDILKCLNCKESYHAPQAIGN